MEIDQLRALLELLKEFGATRFAGNGISIELGGSISVHKHSSDGPKDAQERPKPVDPRVKAMFDRLPAGYQQAFTLGEG